MNLTIRELKENEIEDLIRLRNNVYPRFRSHFKDMEKSVEWFKKFLEKDHIRIFGAYTEEENNLAGTMTLFDFDINFRGKIIKTGGIGGVGVDFEYKKRHICRDLIDFSLKYFMDKGIMSSVLHPFRTDFYKKMGYGLLSPYYRYKLKNSRMPKSKDAHKVRLLSEEDADRIERCFDNHFKTTHGEIGRKPGWGEKNLKNEDNAIFGYEKSGELEGYIICNIINAHPDNFLLHDLSSDELIYTTPESLRALLGLLRNQSDQFEHTIIHTQDDAFFYLFDNPVDDSHEIFPHANHQYVRGSTGLMFRVLDSKQFINNYNNNPDEVEDGLICSFFIEDPFIEANNDEIVLNIGKGNFCLSDKKPEMSVKVSVADFSSMLFGAVNLERLVTLGLAECNDSSRLKEISDRLAVSTPPAYHMKF